MSHAQVFPENSLHGIPIIRFNLPVGPFSLGQVPPPSEFLPDYMDWQYLCDYQDGWFNFLGGGEAYRQQTNSINPASGMGIYVRKTSETTYPLYIGLATLAQANASPEDPAGWSFSTYLTPSSYYVGETWWTGFYFISQQYYIASPDLYIMVYCAGGGWGFGVTAPTQSCLKLDYHNAQNQWVANNSYGITSGLMMATGASCEDIQYQSACEYAGCHWYNNSCHTAAPACTGFTNKTDCEAFGCHWYNNSCHPAPPPSCGSITNATDCATYNCYWYNGMCNAQPGVTCWRCEGQTPVSQQFPPGTDCSETQYPESTMPNCATSCHNPDRPENAFACINGAKYKCVAGVWQSMGEPCVSDCDFQQYESACEAAGCYWYGYPNPIGEPSCQTKPWVEAYLPHIIVGTGVAALLISLLSLRKSPPAYNQPPYQQPTTRRKK